MINTFFSSAPRPALKLTAVVVLPTPPFWLATAIILPMDSFFCATFKCKRTRGQKLKKKLTKTQGMIAY
jgi:hypothetical protein